MCWRFFRAHACCKMKRVCRWLCWWAESWRSISTSSRLGALERRHWGSGWRWRSSSTWARHWRSVTFLSKMLPCGSTPWPISEMRRGSGHWSALAHFWSLWWTRSLVPSRPVSGSDHSHSSRNRAIPAHAVPCQLIGQVQSHCSEAFLYEREPGWAGRTKRKCAWCKLFQQSSLPPEMKIVLRYILFDGTKHRFFVLVPHHQGYSLLSWDQFLCSSGSLFEVSNGVQGERFDMAQAEDDSKKRLMYLLFDRVQCLVLHWHQYTEGDRRSDLE